MNHLDVPIETPKRESKSKVRCVSVPVWLDEQLAEEARMHGFKSVPELVAAILKARAIERLETATRTRPKTA